MFNPRYRRIKFNLIRISNLIGTISAIIVITLLVLEIAYRYQWIDFYKSELTALNSEGNLDSHDNNALIFGDSFTAHPDSYVKTLREQNQDYNFINCAVPGTGIKQHFLVVEDRLKQFKPKKVFYQIYLGNDLIDIKHPVNWKKLGFFRNLYWKLGDQLIFLQHLNRVLGTVSVKNPSLQVKDDLFSSALYNARTKIYLQSDPRIYNDMLKLTGKWAKVADTWQKKFEKIKDIVGPENLVLIIIPHCAQVHAKYCENYMELGAEWVNSYPSDEFQDYLKSNNADIQVIDMTESFIELEKQGHLYYQNDPHLNPNGQAEMAKIILDAIKQ